MVISASFGILSAGDEVINIAALSGILASLRNRVERRQGIDNLKKHLADMDKSS